jgi:signal transduction histidine kinase
MSKKKRFFFIFNSSLVLIILCINNFILNKFNQDNLYYIILLTTLFCLGLYLIISQYIVEDIFTIDDKLKYKIETTMHEINTPVSTIQINTDMLLSKVEDDKNIKRLTRINKACDNLLELYEDMEYYIKKEIDKVEIVTFSIQDSIYSSIEKFEDIKQNISINKNIKNRYIMTDKNGFEIMVSNLISNAIKHNKYIKNIDIVFENNILKIADDGEGIESQDIYSMFDKYYQSNNEIKGLGLGLNIVKEFCDKYKIEMKINSSKDGTIFKLNLENIIKKDTNA